MAHLPLIPYINYYLSNEELERLDILKPRSTGMHLQSIWECNNP